MGTIINGKGYKGKEVAIGDLKVTPYYISGEDAILAEAGITWTITAPDRCTKCSKEAEEFRYVFTSGEFLCGSCFYERFG